MRREPEPHATCRPGTNLTSRIVPTITSNPASTRRIFARTRDRASTFRTPTSPVLERGAHFQSFGETAQHLPRRNGAPHTTSTLWRGTARRRSDTVLARFFATPDSRQPEKLGKSRDYDSQTSEPGVHRRGNQPDKKIRFISKKQDLQCVCTLRWFGRIGRLSFQI